LQKYKKTDYGMYEDAAFLPPVSKKDGGRKKKSESIRK
jgi:hypothetical protein